MQDKPGVLHPAPRRRVKRGIVMERELWEFAEWRASETGERSASSQIREWVREKRATLVGEAA